MRPISSPQTQQLLVSAGAGACSKLALWGRGSLWGPGFLGHPWQEVQVWSTARIGTWQAILGAELSLAHSSVPPVPFPMQKYGLGWERETWKCDSSCKEPPNHTWKAITRQWPSCRQ